MNVLALNTVRRCIALLAVLVTSHWLAGWAHGATYVVDSSAPGAADTNSGTEEKPFKTVQHAANVAQAGDTIYVMAGKYDERVKAKAGGTEGKPVAFLAMPRHSVTVGGFDLAGSYIRVEGFEITADKPATAVQLSASHCEIVDNYIHHMKAAVSGTVGKASVDGNTRDYSAVAHNRIAYNKVYHCEYGFILGGEDWLVENNEVSRLFMYSSGKPYYDCDYSRFFGKRCIQRYNYYHGSIQQEIKTAHVDCLQTFTNNGEIAMDLLFEHNTCFDFHQMCMVESAPHIGSVRGWTLRHNIISADSPAMRGGWGPDIIQTIDVTIENCTISTVNWATIGLRGKESTGGLIRNNILCEAERAVIHSDQHFSAANPVMNYNLTFKTTPLAAETNINGTDPLFVDPQQRNFRLRNGSPAVGTGRDGVTIGALEYPNVYYVDPRHPAATDEPAWGYPGVPLASLSKACAIAQSGETIVLRGGVYREVLAPKNDGVAVRVMQGEQVTISGADLIEGWNRQADGSWTAALPDQPKQVLRDGRSWSDFSYDDSAQRLTMKTGGDPRLHVFETVLRRQVIDVAGKPDAKIEGIKVVDLLPSLSNLSADNARSTSPVTLTTQEDHQQMLRQLGITKLRPGPSGNPDAPNAANYQEAKANPYTEWPEVLKLEDGTPVTTAEAWWKQRRPEIVELFEREVYGRVPEKTPGIRWTVRQVRDGSAGGVPITVQHIVGTVDNTACPEIEVEISMSLTLPKSAAEPVPVLMMFGRTEFDPIPEWMQQFRNRRPGSAGGPRGPSRTDELVAAGWGCVMINPSSIQADNGAGLTRGIIGLTNLGQPRKPDDWGSLRAWAWGASRGLDYLQTDARVDPKRVGIEGVSRYGKAALVTMAFDQRFAMVLVGSSGAGGATPHRRNFGEAVENLTGSGEYHWLAGNFLKYGAEESSFSSKNASDIPVDSHQLISLCAPRLTFISYGIPEKGDANWLDQRGSFMATVAANKVFRLLGSEGLGTSDDTMNVPMPPVNEGLLNGTLAWRQHDGGHTDAPNIKHFIAWSEQHFKAP